MNTNITFYFFKPGTTINGAKYLNFLKNKLNIHMAVHDCKILMHSKTPCHRSKLVKNYFQEKNVEVLDWPGKSSDLNPFENLCLMRKTKSARLTSSQ